MYYGVHKQTSLFDKLVITDTEYTHEHVDWHYHENAYFTYLIQGQLFEANKKEAYTLSPRSLLFHNWQDSHYNIRQSAFARGFHIELEKEWFEGHHLAHSCFQGSLKLDHPLFQSLFDRIYRESKINDTHTLLSVESLLLQVFSSMVAIQQNNSSKKPAWVGKIKDILHHEEEEKLSLSYLSGELDIHPVHLSTEFPRYFRLTLGDYIRRLKVERAIPWLRNPAPSLSSIAYACGFADQSHFIRTFKWVYGITPLAYRKGWKKMLHTTP